MRVAAAAFGPAYEDQWGERGRAVDFFDLKADVEALLAPRKARFDAAAHPAFHPGGAALIALDRGGAGRGAGP